MYIWGGGWNEEDTGSGIEAVMLGLSPQWAEFAAQQDKDYNHKNHRYQIHDGLDCSGYVGWAVYNTLETENGRPGYVCSSSIMAESFSQRGLGTYVPVQELDRWEPGDVMSMKGHVWIVVGMCADGSVVLLHASPPGRYVQRHGASRRRRKRCGASGIANYAEILPQLVQPVSRLQPPGLLLKQFLRYALE